jgi:hypothetical protein
MGKRKIVIVVGAHDDEMLVVRWVKQRQKLDFVGRAFINSMHFG